MTRHHTVLATEVAALVLVCCAAAAGADVKARHAGGPPPHATTLASATVLGTAWKGDNTALPHARVRLRNVTTGRIEAMAVANASGQFTFDNIETGSFIVELVNERDKILAVGQAFSLGPGETVATFVRLGTRAPWASGFFSNVATTAVTAASGLGLTARGSDGQPVSAAQGRGQ